MLPDIFHGESNAGDIEQLKAEMFKLPISMRADFEVFHHFLPGIYIREMFIPAGACVVGKEHLHDHASFVDGDITVVSKDGRQRVTGAHLVVATAGTSRAVLTHAATIWRTVHPNPTEERDIPKLEAMFVLPDAVTLDHETVEALA